MSFRRGVPGVFFEGEGPDAPFTSGSGVRKVGKAKRGVTGTRVRYWPDRQIFLPDAKLSWSKLADRARQTAFLVPGLEIVITDERGIQTDPETDDVWRRSQKRCVSMAASLSSLSISLLISLSTMS